MCTPMQSELFGGCITFYILVISKKLAAQKRVKVCDVAHN
ncbi:hypothetical protein O59_002680 [Cellvibrio sp. BR]|nr:hypothetical protein O59_002680 [Cellvibrio sp. BR]